MKSKHSVLIVMFVVLMSMAGCGVLKKQPTISPVTWAPEPKYPQMDACVAAGGQVNTLLQNHGTWQGYYAFKCVCEEGSSFFGDNWACNKWYPWPQAPSWISSTPLATLDPLAFPPAPTLTPTP